MKILITLVFAFAFFPHAVTAEHCKTTNETPSIRYLGVGALDIHYKNVRLLTDPFYSPQSFGDLITLTPYTSDNLQIEKVLGPIEKNVNAVLIGHGHYDHAADLPAIADYFAFDVDILASKSTQLMIQSEFNNTRITGLETSQFEQWIYIAKGWIRIQGIASEHAPQAFGMNLFPEIHQHAPEHTPEYIWEWSQGTNINWLIDFLKTPNGNEVVERIFVQTSASDYPVGLPNMNDNVKVDKVFLAAASFDNVDNYPTGIIHDLQPENIYMIHWENFFQPWYEQPVPLSLIDLEKLMSEETMANQLEKARLAQPNHCY